MKRKLILLSSTVLALFLAGSVPARSQESPEPEPTSEQPVQEGTSGRN